MTRPIEIVEVYCRCGHTFESPYRTSFNKTLDPWIDDDYVEAMTTTSCPRCGARFEIGPALVVAGGSWLFR
ncbi:MAG: hypothetical protein ACRDJV_09180 [Actinomycetota bacterium]